MQAKFYGMMKETAKELEYFCRQSRSNIVTDSNDDDDESVNITINSLENEASLVSCFKGEKIMIQSFYDFRFPTYYINVVDFERLIII